MLLNNVLNEIEVVDQQLSGAVDFSAIITDSRRAIPGGLFFAISGSRQDGNTYIEEAMARVWLRISEEPLGKHFPISFVQVKDVRLALAKFQSYFMLSGRSIEYNRSYWNKWKNYGDDVESAFIRRKSVGGTDWNDSL